MKKLKFLSILLAASAFLTSTTEIMCAPTKKGESTASTPAGKKRPREEKRAEPGAQQGTRDSSEEKNSTAHPKEGSTLKPKSKRSRKTKTTDQEAAPSHKDKDQTPQPEAKAMPEWTRETNDLLVNTFHPLLPLCLFTKAPEWYNSRERGDVLRKNATMEDGVIKLSYPYYCKLLGQLNEGGGADKYTGGDYAFDWCFTSLFNRMFNNFCKTHPKRYQTKGEINYEDIPLNRSIYRALNNLVYDDYRYSWGSMSFYGLNMLPTYERFLPERLRGWLVEGIDKGRYKIDQLIKTLENLTPEIPEQSGEITDSIRILRKLSSSHPTTAILPEEEVQAPIFWSSSAMPSFEYSYNGM